MRCPRCGRESNNVDRCDACGATLATSVQAETAIGVLTPPPVVRIHDLGRVDRDASEDKGLPRKVPLWPQCTASARKSLRLFDIREALTAALPARFLLSLLGLPLANPVLSKGDIMSTTRRGSFPVPLLRNLAAVASLCAVLLAALPAGAQAHQPLAFFKNYFITGDYAVVGKSLWRKGVNGVAAADIPSLGSGGVPEDADIVAAFLYVQTAESVQGSGIDNATFLGYDLGPFTPAPGSEPGSGTFAKPLVAWENAPTPCWSVAIPGGRRLMTYRVDVLRFLPIDPGTKKQSLDTVHHITVPDAGRLFGDDDESCRETTPSPLPRALGASLLVVYREPVYQGQPMPLSSIVIYDGAYTKRAFAKPMVQPITGFYQASVDTQPAAKMTHIVGDGARLLSEQVLLG
jgi:hypothetical protein